MKGINVNRLSMLQKLLFIFPPLYLIHDMEEILTVEKFLTEKSSIIPFHVSTLEFTFAFTLLWLIGSMGCYIAFIDKKFIGMNPAVYLSLLVPGILLGNGIGHILQFIFFMDYVPGIFTTFSILFPYSIITVKFLLSEGFLTFKRLLVYFLFGFVLQAPLALSALYIAKLLFNGH